MQIPEQWEHLDEEFADQDTLDVGAQILVGADRATLFPDNMRNPDGTMMQSSMCQLMRSSITDQVIMFCACENHDVHEQEMDIEEEEASIHNTQVDLSVQAVSALTSVMESMAITDVEDISMASDEE